MLVQQQSPPLTVRSDSSSLPSSLPSSSPPPMNTSTTSMMTPPTVIHHRSSPTHSEMTLSSSTTTDTTTTSSPMIMITKNNIPSMKSSSSFGWNSSRRMILTLVILFALFLFVYLMVKSTNHKFDKNDSGGDDDDIYYNTPVALTPEEQVTFLENYKKKQLLNSVCSIEKNDGMLTREIIGPHVWNVFHAFIENYSNHQDDSKLLQWIQLTTELFPCQQCSKDFRGILKKFPYRGFESYYKSKSRWMCKLHNLVNQKTNKDKLFDCDDEKELRMRYKLQKC